MSDEAAPEVDAVVDEDAVAEAAAAKAAEEAAAKVLVQATPKEKPRDLMYAYAQDRLRHLQVRRHIDGDAMLEGWKREEQYHQAVLNLLDWMAQKELERVASADKAKGRRGPR